MKAKTLKAGKIVDVDPGGWVAMPKGHWDVIKKKLEGDK